MFIFTVSITDSFGAIYDFKYKPGFGKPQCTQNSALSEIYNLHSGQGIIAIQNSSQIKKACDSSHTPKNAAKATVATQLYPE